MLLAPPLLWLAFLWSEPARIGLPAPVLGYGLAALAMLPGLIGLGMLDLRRRTMLMILPLYIVAMAIVLLATLGASGCILLGECG